MATASRPYRFTAAELAAHDAAVMQATAEAVAARIAESTAATMRQKHASERRVWAQVIALLITSEQRTPPTRAKQKGPRS